VSKDFEKLKSEMHPNKDLECIAKSYDHKVGKNIRIPKNITEEPTFKDGFDINGIYIGTPRDPDDPETLESREAKLDLLEKNYFEYSNEPSKTVVKITGITQLTKEEVKKNNSRT
jgi:hypothetical protein